MLIGYDWLYWVIAIPLLLLSLGANLFLRVIYSNYKKRYNSTHTTGMDTVMKFAQHYNFNIDLEQGYGDLTDHYNPMSKTVSLSPEVANISSIASVGIAAHEMGHVAQHQRGFFLMTLRSLILPVVNLGSTLGYFVFILGVVLSFSPFAWLGVLLFSGTTFFAILTLPIEIDASRRGLNMIKELNLLDPVEIGGARTVLFAAALTYVAGTIQSLGTLLYYVMRARGLSDRD